MRVSATEPMQRISNWTGFKLDAKKNCCVLMKSSIYKALYREQTNMTPEALTSSSKSTSSFVSSVESLTSLSVSMDYPTLVAVTLAKFAGDQIRRRALKSLA